MTRKTWWPIILALVALAVGTLTVSGSGAPEDGGNGSPIGDGIWETDGEWDVEDGEDLLYENVTLYINGNITIKFGGKLTLRSVKLVMNCTEDLEFHIRVTTGGELVLTDSDNDFITTSDRTELRSWYQSARYTIGFDGGAKVSVMYSRISDLGDAEAVGLEIDSDDVVFEWTVVDSFSSVLVDNSAPVFRDSRFTGDLASSLYFLNSGAVIEDCQIINCYYGINAKGSPSPGLRDTDLANCFFPLNLEGATMTMEGGLLEAAPYGTDIRLNQSSKLTLVDVTFSPGSISYLDNISQMDVWWTLTLRVTDQAYQPLEDASVKVNDSWGATVFTGTTDGTGTVSIQLLDSIMNATKDEPRNPHSVYVVKDRYHALVTINVTETMNREVTLLTNLAPIISVSSPLPGTRMVMGQTILLDASATYDPNGDPMTFNWTTNIGYRVLYKGPDPRVTSSLLLGESEITLTVSDGEGGVNSTTIPVEVLQASQQTKTVTESQFIATLVASYGGSGTIIFEKAVYPKPYPQELIGIFLKVHHSGDALLASSDLEVSYSPTLIPYGMDESSLVIVREDGGLWVEVPGSSVDTEEHVVTATVPAFGIYAVRGSMPANIPPRMWMMDGTERVEPYDIEVGPLETVDLTIVVEDELPHFARLSVANLPDFLHLDGTTKRIVGTSPVEADSYYLVLMVTDIGGLTDQASIYLNVTTSRDPPQLWSGIVDPPNGNTYTTFEITVVYVSPDNLAPVYIRADFGDNDTAEMTPVNLTDDEYRAGVMYHVFVRLEKGTSKVWFEAFDGIATNRTEEPIEVVVESYSVNLTNQEVGIILITLIATLIIILIIRQTSDRYKRLKEAHYSLDKEDEIEYIEPGKTGTEGDEEEDEGSEGPEDPDDDEGLEEPPDEEADDQVPARRMDADDMRDIDKDVERLEEELDDLDGDIDQKEEELAHIDEEIEDIIDELDKDRERVG